MVREGRLLFACCRLLHISYQHDLLFHFRAMLMVGPSLFSFLSSRKGSRLLLNVVVLFQLLRRFRVGTV